MSDTSEKKPEKWWHSAHKAITLDARLYVMYGAGILASFSALFELAVKYGGWFKPFGIALPVVIDVYWMTALQVALDASRSKKERGWASAHAFLAISLSIIGNIMFHELNTGSWHFSTHDKSALIATLACIPVVLTGTLTHLVLLARRADAGAGAGKAAPAPVQAPVPAPAPAVQPTPPAPAPVQAPAPAPAPVQRPNRPAPATGTGSGAPRPNRAAAARPATAAVPADAELRMKIAKEMRARDRPAIEDTQQKIARLQKFVDEFHALTGGARMNADEASIALRTHKSKVAALRACISEPGEPPAAGEQERGEETG
jgi:hypothetical protein